MELSIYKQKTKNRLERILRWFDRDPERIELRATRDWNLMLIFFILINILILITTTIFFFSINKRELLPVSELSTDSIARLDKGKVEKAAGVIEKREAGLQDLLKSPPKIVDPSL
ncbi:MAG: hypothetical protein WC724_03285 [Candidatus Paceibacterota bacterium]|jgi:hypothetical protein